MSADRTQDNVEEFRLVLDTSADAGDNISLGWNWNNTINKRINKTKLKWRNNH